MAVPHRPPCDAALMRAGRCLAPAGRAEQPWVLAATILGSSMIFVDGTIVNVALPVVQRQFGATLAGAQWVVEAYALCLASFLLVGGAMGDRYGRRRVFAIGGVVFAIASAACGAASSLGQLVVARAAQGIGGALLAPSSLALISGSFAAGDRGRAIGTWSGSTAVLAGAGPVLGGWLIQHASWRWAFWVNLPIALLTLSILFARVSESRDPDAPEALDWPGAALATLGLGMIVYGLLESGSGIAGPRTRVLMVSAGVAALGAFVAIERRARAPMMPVSLFRSRRFTGANALTVLLYAALGGALFFLPFDLIQVQHRSPTAAGAALLPFILVMSALSRWSGGLVTRYGPRLPLVVGPALAALGFLLLALTSAGRSYWVDVLPGIATVGLGMAVSVAPLTTTVMSAAPSSAAGAASGINNAASRVAGLLAIAVLGLVLLAGFRRDLDRRLAAIPLPATVRRDVESQSAKLAELPLPRGATEETRRALREAVAQAFVAGYREVMLIAAALALSGALVSWRWIGAGRGP